jgi:hypothetical protein
MVMMVGPKRTQRVLVIWKDWPLIQNHYIDIIGKSELSIFGLFFSKSWQATYSKRNQSGQNLCRGNL